MVKVKFYERDGADWFYFEGPVSTPSTPLIVDTKATSEQKKQYLGAWEQYQKAKRVKEVMIEASAPVLAKPSEEI